MRVGRTSRYGEPGEVLGIPLRELAARDRGEGRLIRAITLRKFRSQVLETDAMDHSFLGWVWMYAIV